MKKTLLMFVTMACVTSMSVFGQSTKIIDENFQEWDATEDEVPDDCEDGLMDEPNLTRTLTITTSGGDMEIEVQMLKCGIAPDCDSKRVERDGALGTPGVSVGYVQLSKVTDLHMEDLTVEHFGTDTDTLGQFMFGPIPQIDSIVFAHSATGSNRGIRIFKSTDGESWERATNDEFNISDDSQAGDVRSVVIDEEEVYIKFTAGFDDGGISQNARLHNLEVYGEPGELTVGINDYQINTFDVIALGQGKYKLEGDFSALQVYNSEGKLILNDANPENNIVSLNDMPAGLYIIKAEDQNGNVSTGKIVNY